MGRKGTKKDVVQFDTKVTSIRFPKVLMQDMVSMIKKTRYFTNRSDFLIYSIRRFNEYSLEHIFKHMSSDPEASKRYWELSAKMSDDMMIQLNAYGEIEPESPDDPDAPSNKVTYSITEGLLEYIALLNQNTWKYDSVQTYMRVAVAVFVDDLRKNMARIQSMSSIVGQDFVNATCPFVGRGSIAYDEGVLTIDEPRGKRNDNEVIRGPTEDIDDSLLSFEDEDSS